MPEKYKEEEEQKIVVNSDDDAVCADTGSDAVVPGEVRDLYVGTIINNRYEILSMIGRGATSAVYKARNRDTNQIVAIKILHSHLAFDATIVRRFQQEAKTATILQHPNIVSVRDYSTTESGNPFLVMDFVEGMSLFDTIRAAGWLPVQRALAVFPQVCAALSAAHEKGIVHRDLKPSNIMLTTGPDGNPLVKVLDFGIAKVLPAQGDTVMKLTQTGEMLGSILYMSPEQCMDHDLDGRSDVYSLGCVMYEALTGKAPFSARTAFETMNKHMSETPERLSNVRPDINWPSGLEDVLLKSMQKSPQNRYASVQLLGHDLQRLLAGATPSHAAPGHAVSGDSTASNSVSSSSTSYGSSPGGTVAEATEGTDETSLERLEGHKTKAEYSFRLCRTMIFAILCVVLVLLGVAAKSGFDQTYIFPLVGAFGAINVAMMSYKHSRKIRDRVIEAVTAVMDGKVQDVSISKISWTSGGGVQVTIGNPEFRNLHVSPIDISNPIWKNLISACDLEQVTGAKVFPLPGKLYFNSNRQPVAVALKGRLTWVVRW